jgi:hypothetical protein
VGQAAGVELSAFIHHLEQMPDLDAIVRGEPVEPPREIDLQYAVASALAGRAIRARGTPDGVTIQGRILNYAGRFPQREMGIMMVNDLHRALGNELFAVPEFADWSEQVADLMLYET